jgi:hypothetical protein
MLISKKITFNQIKIQETFMRSLNGVMNLVSTDILESK